MAVVSRIGSFANSPVGAGLAFGASALLYTTAYVQFVNPRGLFVVPTLMFIGSATVAAAISGAVIWRYPLSRTARNSYRTDALSGVVVGAMTLTLAPPLAILGMTIPALFESSVSLITPILVAGYLINAVAWGLVGTVIATVATVGTPVLVTTATGIGLGYLRKRSDSGDGVVGADGRA